MMATRSFRRALASAFAVLAIFLATPASAQVSLTTAGTPYTQDFNSLASSGTSSTVPTGWAFIETGSSANTTFTAGLAISGRATPTVSGRRPAPSGRSAACRAEHSCRRSARVPEDTGVAITALDIAYSANSGGSVRRAGGSTTRLPVQPRRDVADDRNVDRRERAGFRHAEADRPSARSTATRRRIGRPSAPLSPDCRSRPARRSGFGGPASMPRGPTTASPWTTFR